MKLNQTATNLLNACFNAQEKFPIRITRVTDIKKCLPGQHKTPQLILNQDGSMEFRCNDCMKNIIPTRWKIVK
jgi:hypothetical protein